MKYPMIFSNSALENRFISDYNEKTMSATRLGYWLALILYAIFGVLDIIMLPVSYQKVWVIRFCIVIPFTIVVLLLSYIKSLTKYIQIIISFNAVIMGLGIVAMITIAFKSEPGFRFYYAGLMLVIMGICSIFRLRFYYALLSSFAIILGYEVSAIFIQDIDIINNFNFISSNFFFLSSNIIGLLAAYYLELSMRVEFIQQEEISERHKEINILMENMNLELDLARHIQTNLLPGICPYLSNIRIHAIYRPMEHLGGDFYDFIRFVETNLIGIFISDVSGHGIPAALITSMLKTLNSTAGTYKFSTSEFLKYINYHITGKIGDNFLTAIYMLYDSESRTLKYSRAGHPYPLLIRNGQIAELGSAGGIIGLNSELTVEEREIKLDPGDKILLYTDGLTEELSPGNIMFENTFFNEILPSVTGNNVEEIITIIYQNLVYFKGDDKLSDDVCIVGIEIF